MDFEEAHRIMEGHANRLEKASGVVAKKAHVWIKKLKHETWLEKSSIEDTAEGEPAFEYGLRYFKTNILTFHPEFVEISPGDWFSRSTHDRLNEYMPRGFRVYGQTFQELGLGRPLGFISTPQGTYPYAIPVRFNYDGSPTTMGGRHANAYEAVRKIPSYVNEYLDRLFSRGEFDAVSRQSALTAFSTANTDCWQLSKNVGRAVLTPRYYRHLLGVITEFEDDSLNNLEHKELVRMLTERGAEVFKRPQTKRELAQRTEDTLFFNRSIVHIRKNTLRRYLRSMLIGALVEALGFDDVTWNRR